MSKLEKGVIIQTIKYQICIVTTLQSFYYMHRFLRLTTYLTRTGGRGDGDNGENGEKKGQKRSKKARNGLKKDIKAIVFRLGARCRRFEPCHSDHSTACSDGIFLVTGGFLLFLRLFRGYFRFYFDDHFGITGLSRAPVSSLRMCAANNGKDEPAVHALKNLPYLLVYRMRLAKHIIVDRFLKKSQILRINLANRALVFSSTSWYNIITG